MKLDPADHERYISLEIGVDELALLHDLLRVETIYQIRKQVASSADVENRTSSIINAFGVFQDFDTQIKDLQAATTEFQKNNATVEPKPINMAVLSKNRIKIYHFLCTKTTELTLPDHLKKKCNELGPNLTKKLETALNSAPLLDSNIDKDVEVKVNMLGQRGLA
jgi:hypothetical protein